MFGASWLNVKMKIIKEKKCKQKEKAISNSLMQFYLIQKGNKEMTKGKRPKEKTKGNCSLPLLLLYVWIIS
jgi:hypothetical protein